MVTYGGMTFLAKLRHLMKKKGLTNKELGPMIGTYPERISKWFGGSGLPDIYQCYRISRVLEVPMEFLADDDLDEPPNTSELSEDERLILNVIKDLGLTRAEAVRRLASCPVEPATAHGPGRWLGPQRDETEADMRRERERLRPKRDDAAIQPEAMPTKKGPKESAKGTKHKK